MPLPDPQGQGKAQRNFENLDGRADDLETQVTDLDTLLTAGLGVWRTVYGPVAFTHTGVAGMSTTRRIYSSDGAFVTSAVDTTRAPYIVYLDDADYAVAGMTTQLRVRAIAMTNNVDPAIDITFGLYEITGAPGTTASQIQFTIAAGFTGNTASITNANLGANDRETAVGTEFTFPADGYYALGAVGSGSQAGNCALYTSIQLQMRHV